MDYERIELLSRKLYNPRVETRLRTANSILFKLECGIFLKDDMKFSSCISILLEGISNSFAITLQSCSENVLMDNKKEAYQLISLLLSIVQLITKMPNKFSFTSACSNVLNNLYQMKMIQCLDSKLVNLIDETAASICSLGETKESIELQQVHNDELLQAKLCVQNDEVDRDYFHYTQSNKIGLYHGAGAILNSRLVYYGWKFPDFVITEHDERYLFDVEVKVKLQHESASRDIWDVLLNFPVQAIMKKTNLLHAIIDIVGGPFSKRDIDVNPSGLNPLVALKWLEVLLLKCQHAFSVQLDGSICCRTLNTEQLYNYNNDDINAAVKLDIPDVSMKLAEAMYALRHPILPPRTASSSTHFVDENTKEKKYDILAKLALIPLPSYTGLAFASCAAAMPLLQTRDTDIARSVYSVLEAALPYIMEPSFKKTDYNISDIECGRFQHLLNRLEQILSFFGTHFDFHSFLTLVYSDDDETNVDEIADKLKDYSFELIFLSTIILIFSSLPSESILPSSKLDDGLSRKLKVGACTTVSLYKIAACKSLWKFLPHNTKEVIAKTLYILDDFFLTTINNLHQAVECAEVFISTNTWSESPESLLDQLINAAEIVVESLVKNCSLYESPLPEKTKLSFCESLPIILIACEENNNEEQYVPRVMDMLLRIFTCGEWLFKSHLVRNILMFAHSSRSYNSQEPSSTNQIRFEMASRLSIEPFFHHYLITKLATPQIMHALLVLGYFQNNFDSEQDVFITILNNISEYLITTNELFFIPEISLLSWAQLLPSLKLLEWSPNIPYSEKSALVDFTRLLNDRCAACNCFQSKLILAKCLIMGLFHFDNSVRIASALSIQRDLLLIESALETTERNNIEINDIFSKQNHIQLHQLDFTIDTVNQPHVERKIKKTNLSAASLKVTAKVPFTHADIRKVASIGCNHELDASIRVSAMIQLLEMLNSDSQLIRTADITWVTNVTKECLETLKKLIPFQFAVSASTLTIDKLHDISDSNCRLLILAMKISIFFISHIKTLKDLLSLYCLPSSSSPSIISIEVLLKLLLVSDVTNSKVINTTWSQTLQILRYLSAQLFFMLCCSADNWIFTSTGSEDNRMIYSFQPLTHNEFEEKVKEDTQDLFLIPSFLIKNLFYPTSKYVVATNEYHKSLDIVSQKIANPKQIRITGYYKSNINRKFPVNEISQIVLSDFTYPSVDRIYVAASTKIFGMIVDARNHVQLREALSSTLCIFQANSTLLQVFLDLKISLVAAVSNIVTINPRTHKDHITLSSVILFMNSILQCLKSIYGLKITSIPECLEFFHDVLDSVLPNIALYFKAHGKLSSSELSSSQFGSDDKTIEKEYANITSFVRTAYLKLLLTISSFCDPDQHLLLGELLSGNYIIYYTYSMACSELHSGWDRYLAIGILDNLVRLHNGCDTLLRCASDTTYTLSEVSSSKFTEVKNRNDLLVIGSLVRMIRLLRTPDSMLGTSALVGGLKLLYLCLFHAKTYQPLFFNSKQVNQNWSWLIRLMYDRRTEVKLLALEIVSLVLDSDEFDDKNALNLSDDSLEVSPKHISDDEKIFNNATTTSSNYAWPPFEVLHYIVTDTNESVSLRSKAVDILVREIIFKEFHKETENKLGNILNFVSSCLSVDQDFSSAISIQWALDIVLSLLGINESNDQGRNVSSIRNESITLMRALKIPQQITELLDSGLKELLTRAALARVRLLEDNYVSFHKDAFNLHTDFAISRNQVHHLVLVSSGWSQLQQTLQSLEYNMIKSISTSICCFYFQLNKFEPELFRQSIKYSNILFLAFSNFSEIDEKNIKCNQEKEDLIFKFGNINAQAELLSLFIADHSLVFKKLIQEHELIPINVLTSIALTFEQIIEVFKSKTYAKLEIAMMQCLNSCLRFLNILVSDSICCISLGLSDEKYAMIETLKYVFLQLFEMRSSEIFEVYSKQIKIELASRIDLTIAHFMQYSIEARELFIMACKQQCFGQSTEHKRKEFPSFFHEHISTIAAFIELSSNVASITCNETSTEIQKSLQKLKTKRAHLDNTSAIVTKKKLLLNQSTNSSLASINTSASQPASKWRIKNRSYVWNSDRDQNSSLKSIKSAELPSSLMKLQLWNALILLSHCFPNCKEAIDWAIDLKLPVYLSKLLRYANRYTLSTVFHFSSPVQGDLIGDVNSKWVPSNGMISAAICSLCCAFSYEHIQAKLNFACSGEAPAVSLNDLGGAQPLPGNNGTSLHQLVAMGISRSTIPVVRWLCLSLAGSLLRSCSRSAVVLGNPALKSTFTQIITLSLQRSMHASSSDPESVLYLVNTLTCLLSSDEDILHIIQLCSKDDSTQLQLSLGLIKYMSSKPSDIPLGNIKLITFPELMQWIWSKTGNGSNALNIELIAAICRCLGRISAIDKKNKTIGNIMSESMLSILCECFQIIDNKTVIATSAVTLWNIVHHSEKAKCIIREQLRRNNQLHSVQLKNKENAFNSNINYSTDDVEGSVVQAKLILDSLLLNA